MMTTCNINPHILAYIEQIESGSIRACEEQHQLTKLVRHCFETENIYTDNEQLDNYLSQVKYFPYEKLFSWEEFVLALHLCTYRVDGLPRWPDLFLLIGRGAGKDGYIAFQSWCLASPFNNIYRYDVDICANNESQAMAPFEDIWNVLEDPKFNKKMAKHFYYNKEEIIGIKTKARIKYRTNNPKGKDGLRSGEVVLNEIHQYMDYLNINVFTTGLGKKRHPRRLYATTNGDVRDGPLDDYIKKSKAILTGSQPDNGWLPFICNLNDKKQVHDPKNWEMANPSLPYLPDLMEEIRKEFEDWKLAPSQFTAFMTKRMNIPDGNPDLEVTSWENILKTNKEIPDLSGLTGVIGMDYASIGDFASVGILVKKDGIRYWISHSWMCLQSHNLSRLHIPWREWEKAGHITAVDDVEINPDLMADWISEQAKFYNLEKLSLDNFRLAVVANALNKIGFDSKEKKNIKLIRPSDIIKVIPVIDSAFKNNLIIWGDNPLMRWYTNNTKKIPASLKAKQMTGQDENGNYQYAKIEPKSRKTDGFMAFAAAMTLDGDLENCQPINTPDLPCFTF